LSFISVLPVSVSTAPWDGWGLSRKAAVALCILLSVALLAVFLFQDSLFGFLRPSQPPDFGLSASPASLSLQGWVGSSAEATITVSSTGGFSSEVWLNVSASTGFLGVLFTIDPPSVTPPAGGAAQARVTLTVYSGVTRRTHFIDVTGRSDERGLRHTIRVFVTVE